MPHSASDPHQTQPSGNYSTEIATSICYNIKNVHMLSSVWLLRLVIFLLLNLLLFINTLSVIYGTRLRMLYILHALGIRFQVQKSYD